MSIRSQLIGAAVCVALGMASAWTVQEWRHGAKQARSDAAHAELLEQQAQAVVESVQAARNLEKRYVFDLENERDNVQRENEALAADVAAGRTVSERLRAELAPLRARAAGSDTAPTQRGEGKQGIDAIGVLADMYEGLERRGRTVAEYADKLRIAGLGCERSYDHVRSAE